MAVHVCRMQIKETPTCLGQCRSGHNVVVAYCTQSFEIDFDRECCHTPRPWVSAHCSSKLLPACRAFCTALTLLDRVEEKLAAEGGFVIDAAGARYACPRAWPREGKITTGRFFGKIRAQNRPRVNSPSLGRPRRWFRADRADITLSSRGPGQT